MAVDGVRFTKDGPSIPVKLLQTLEEGGLTIFCGAGVSRCCGLPDFSGLVNEACTRLGRPMQTDEKELFNQGSFDAALGLIENRIPKPQLRRIVAEILDIKAGSDLETHKALLNLGTSKQKHLRLVTTNFDRAFELAASPDKPTFDYAPYLPLPGVDWDSVAHLHGGLGNTRDPDAKALVLTSADFGRAYITEGWASHFLSELFRRSAAVLFIGYSVSDPAIRYIVDAFAADRGDQRSHVAVAYILSGSAVPAQDERRWKSRGIEPISYDPRDNHVLLHETLRNCAAQYRTGFFDRASIVLKHGSHSPIGTLDREAVSQIAWALKDETGHAARRFAELNPPAPIDWLDTLGSEGLLSLSWPVQKSVPAVTWLPASYLALSLHRATEGLCGWICAHLGTPQLIQWVIESGYHLHPELARRVRARLSDSDAPQVPKGAERIWRFLSAKSAPVQSRAVSNEALFDLRAIDDQDWNPLVRDLVLSFLAPTIEFKKVFRWGTDEDFDEESVRSYADIELVPAAGANSRDIVERLLRRTDADSILRELIGEFTRILHRGMTYLEFLGQANSDFDATYSDLPSIDDHPQNSEFRHWPVYVHLLRTAWERVSSVDPARAREEVTRWMRLRFPLFRRFVLWSAGKPGGISTADSVEYLSNQPSSTLWGLDTHRELLQYLRRIGQTLSSECAERLIGMILAGPARAQYRAEITEEKFADIRDRVIHIRLAKLRDGGLALPAVGQAAWDQILGRHPAWPLSTSERDEFVVWSGGAEFGGLHDFVPHLNDYLEWDDESIVADLMTNPTSSDTLNRWRGLLSGDVRRAIRVLESLGQSKFFELGIWSLATEYLGGEETKADGIRLYGEFAPQLGSDFISKHLYTLTGVIDRYYHEKNRAHEDSLWRLWDLLLEPAARVIADEDEDDDPVMRALNSPIGNLTQALLIKFGELNAKTYEEVPEPFRDRMEMLLNGSGRPYQLSRLLLSRALAWLYRLNPDLVVSSLLSRFDWSASEEARYVWLGYLMGPRITPELWPALRPLLLNTLGHSGELGRYEDQLYSFFAFLLLHADFALESADARRALTIGSPKGRSQVAWYWWRQADSATDYGATLYRDRLKYLLTNVWPLEQELREDGASESLAKLAMCCGTEFPEAVVTILPLLSKLNRPHGVIWSFREKDLPEKYPDATLGLIEAVIDDEIEAWGWQDLRALLRRISAVRAASTEDPRFVRLDAIVRRFE